MKNFKKLCSVALAVVFCFSLISSVALAAEGETVAILRYTESGVTEDVPYTSVEDALGDAQANDTVYVVKPTALGTTAEVKDDVTLVIPTSETLVAAEALKEGNENVYGDGVTGKAFATLEIPAGVTLTVKGTLIVAGNQQGINPRTGFLTGDYGAINLKGDIIVEGELYARGEIYGEGTVTANNGSTVYQRFEIADWRGGRASYNAYLINIFPFDLYQLAGISARLVINKGATMKGQAFIYASSEGHSEEVAFIGNSAGDESLVYFSGTGDDSSDDSITFYNNTITVYGEAATNNLIFVVRAEIYGIPIDAKVSTSDKQCAFGYNTNVVIASGSTFTVNTHLKVLPGCTITVEDGGTVSISDAGSAFFYTADKYNSAWNHANWPTASDEVGNATLKIVTGEAGTGTVTGLVGSTSETLSNIEGLGTLTPTGEVPIVEITQSGTNVSPANVTFYTITLPTTAE